MTVHVHANCAMSLDGCLGLPGPRPLKLSSPEDFRRVHELRARSDAILIGVGTSLADDPKLTVKWELLGRAPGKNPTRIVLDSNLRTRQDSELSRHDTPTILFHKEGAHGGPPNAQRVAVASDASGQLLLKQVLAELDRRGVSRLLVEGGTKVLSAFLSQRLVDELTLYVAPVLVGFPDAPRLFQGRGPLDVGLRFDKAENVGGGVLLRYIR